MFVRVLQSFYQVAQLQGGTRFLFRHEHWRRSGFLPSQLGPFPLLVTEGPWTLAQPTRSCEGKAAPASLQGPAEQEEDPHPSQQLGFAAHRHVGDKTDPCLGSSFGINSEFKVCCDQTR